MTSEFKKERLIAHRGRYFTSGIFERRYFTIVSLLEKTGKPTSDYTNEQWKHDFELLKSRIKQSQFRQMTVIPESSYSPDRTYHGKTQYQCYCDFINDILSNIRKGEIDYCFYIYQIAELLKYERDDLQVRYLEKERCFRLSLKIR